MERGVRSKIRPSEINTDGPFAPSFGFDRANISANILVRLAQHNGSWRNFKIDEADQLVDTAFLFNGLTRGRFPLIIQQDDGKYFFTDEFIEKCAASAPKWPPPVVPPPTTVPGAK